MLEFNTWKAGTSLLLAFPGSYPRMVLAFVNPILQPIALRSLGQKVHQDPKGKFITILPLWVAVKRSLSYIMSGKTSLLHSNEQCLACFPTFLNGYNDM